MGFLLFGTAVHKARYNTHIHKEGSSLPGQIAETQEVSFAQEKKLVDKLGGKLVTLGLHNEACSAEKALHGSGG